MRRREVLLSKRIMGVDATDKAALVIGGLAHLPAVAALYIQGE